MRRSNAFELRNPHSSHASFGVRGSNFYFAETDRGPIWPYSLALFLALTVPKGAANLTAQEIRESFVNPELEAFAKGEIPNPARSLALATWELAAQLAEFNDRFNKIGLAGKKGRKP